MLRSSYLSHGDGALQQHYIRKQCSARDGPSIDENTIDVAAKLNLYNDYLGKGCVHYLSEHRLCLDLLHHQKDLCHSPMTNLPISKILKFSLHLSRHHEMALNLKIHELGQELQEHPKSITSARDFPKM